MTQLQKPSNPLQFEPRLLPSLTGFRASPQVSLPPWLEPIGTESFEFSPASSPAIQTPSWTPLPHQRPPDGDWLYWLLIAGRGSGKTDAGAHYVDTLRTPPPWRPESASWRRRSAMHARSVSRATRACTPRIPSIHFNRSWGELRWPNGSQAQLFGAYTPEDIERFRGPQFHLVWLEEFAAWRQIKPALRHAATRAYAWANDHTP